MLKHYIIYLYLWISGDFTVLKKIGFVLKHFSNYSLIFLENLQLPKFPLLRLKKLDLYNFEQKPRWWRNPVRNNVKSLYGKISYWTGPKNAFYITLDSRENSYSFLGSKQKRIIFCKSDKKGKVKLYFDNFGLWDVFLFFSFKLVI